MSDTQDEEDDGGWAGFYEKTRGRPTRAPFAEAVSLAEQRQGGPGMAADIGCGDGAETHALLKRGWRVLAVDSEPAAARFVGAEVDADDAPRLQVLTASFDVMVLPALDFAWAGMALPFSGPAGFTPAWQRILAALEPGGCFAGHFFGPNDSWATPEPELAIHDAVALRALLAGFDIVVFNEREWNGPSGGGPKHWHLFEVAAFR